MLQAAMLAGIMALAVAPDTDTVMPGYTTHRMNVTEAMSLTQKENLALYSPAMVSVFAPRPRFTPWWFIVNQWAGFSPQIGRTPHGYIVTWINTLRSPQYKTHDLLAQAFTKELNRPAWDPGIYCSTRLVRSHLRVCTSYELSIMSVTYQVSTRVQYSALRMTYDHEIQLENGYCPQYPSSSQLYFDIWYQLGMTCDTKRWHLSIAVATWTARDGTGGIELLHFADNIFRVEFVEEPLAETQTWPDICLLLNERLLIVWQNTDGYGIWGVLRENNGDHIEGHGVFEITKGMEPGYFWRPTCMATYGGRFTVLWKEDPYYLDTTSDKFPYPTIWMREFEMDGVVMYDNPVPRRVTVSAWDTVGYIPAASMTLEGTLWVSWMGGKAFQGGNYDRFGNILDYWFVYGSSDYGYPNVSRLGQIPFASLDAGFAMTAISGVDRRVVCYRYDPLGELDTERAFYTTDLEFLLYKNISEYWDKWFLMNHTDYWTN